MTPIQLYHWSVSNAYQIALTSKEPDDLLAMRLTLAIKDIQKARLAVVCGSKCLECAAALDAHERQHWLLGVHREPTTSER